MSNYKASKIFFTCFLVIFAALVTPSMSTTSCSGPFLNRGNVGRPKCNRYTTGADCAVESVQETAEITCKTLMANAVPVDPQLYRGVGVHLVPMAHHYYYARMNTAFGSCCPTCIPEIQNMSLSTPWSGFPTGQAWDIGYESRAFRVDCQFPTDQFPFICTGKDGTKDVRGDRLGTLYYIHLLTNDATPGAGVWTLFGQCWDALTPTDPSGTNRPVSWNVFSLTQKTLSEDDKTAIKTRLAQIGFPTTSPSLLEIVIQ